MDGKNDIYKNSRNPHSEDIDYPFWVYLVVAFIHGSIPGVIAGFIIYSGRSV